MTSRKNLALVTSVAAALMLTACGGSTPSNTSTQEDAMYCDLIDPQTVEPIVGDNEIKDFGGPVPQDKYRMISCNLVGPDGDPTDLLSVTEFEFFSTENRDDQLTRAENAMTELSQNDDTYYVALKPDNSHIGYAHFTGKAVAATLVTDTRSVSVLAPTTADRAEELTPLMLQIVQEFDANLREWDAENPAD